MLQIRPVELQDNSKLAETIRTVLIELGVPKVGTAYADTSLDFMFETYRASNESYFVITDGDRIIGGAGIAPLANYEGNTCELQKMYLLAEVRGLGYGMQLIQTCLDFALAAGFEDVYLETMPYMKNAQKLYAKAGFEYIDAPLGNTGHSACPIYMLRKL
ncbi:GNAT family N-acetyltransferase [Leeuwenhoekiella sp. LLG6367-2.1]|uniref:GNAT family N-acetyltransferase n=1 Tax=Leeuwenhoekiella sp. LLG6367-2.1 TaxID=3160833 RepID=UPI00386B5F48